MLPSLVAVVCCLLFAVRGCVVCVLLLFDGYCLSCVARSLLSLSVAVCCCSWLLLFVVCCLYLSVAVLCVLFVLCSFLNFVAWRSVFGFVV